MDRFPSFPLFLEEIDVQGISCIRFNMPASDIGRNDVRIYIEYGINTSDERKLVCDVWAHILNTTLRGYLLTFTTDKPQKAEDEIDVIVQTLNENEDFYTVLRHYLDWADKNLVKKQ